MNPITHLLVGWTITVPLALQRRDRALVVFASVAPDLDSVVVLGDLAAGRPLDSLELWSRYHHQLAHNLAFALAFALVCYLSAQRKLLTGTVAFVAINLHFLCDIVGARGPDGYQWPIPYLLPFTDAWQLAVKWQWPLNAWQNITFTVLLLILTFYVAWRRGLSPVGLLSSRAERVFVTTLRQRFGPPRKSNA